MPSNGTASGGSSSGHFVASLSAAVVLFTSDLCTGPSESTLGISTSSIYSTTSYPRFITTDNNLSGANCSIVLHASSDNSYTSFRVQLQVQYFQTRDDADVLMLRDGNSSSSFSLATLTPSGPAAGSGVM